MPYKRGINLPNPGAMLGTMNSFGLFQKSGDSKKAPSKKAPSLSKSVIEGALKGAIGNGLGNNTNYGPNAGVHPHEHKGGGDASVAGAPDPIEQAKAALYGLITSAANLPDSASYSSKDIKSMLEGAGSAASPYNAQIATIRDQNAGARQDATVGSKKIRAMYRALAKDDANMGQNAKAAQEQLASQINQQAATGNDANQQRAQALMADNAKYGGDVAAQLNSGIAQAAATEQGGNTTQAANFAAAALNQGGNFQNYFRQNKSADKLEGTTKAADLITQLQGYLQGNRDKVAELAGQGAAAVQSARSSLLSQIQSSQQKASSDAYGAKQDEIGNLSKLLNTQIGENNTNTDNQRADAQLQLQIQQAQNNAAQKQLTNQNSSTLSPDEVSKLLSSSGAFKNMTMPDIIKALQGVYGQ